MPKWNDAGGRIITTLFEAAAYHRTIRLQCYCGHVAVLNPHALWWHFSRWGWDDRIAKVRDRLKCSGRQRQGGVTITAVEDAVTLDALPMPPEGEWKRTVNQFRN